MLPRKLCPTTTSGSYRWIVASNELSRARSALTVWKGDRSVLARASIPGGNFSIGLTMVWRLDGCLSGGVGSSILPDVRQPQRTSTQSHSHPSHVRAVTHSSSVLFSL